MRKIVGIFAGVLMAALAQTATVQAEPSSVCIWSYMIDHTKVVDSRTILFHMKDGKVWKNTLQGPCPGLKFHGFVYRTTADEICSNAQSIRVIDSGEVCLLGPFEPAPGKKA